MLFGKLLTCAASIFADVRTYWSPEAVERVTKWKPDGIAENGFIHLINSGAAALDGTGAYKNEKGESVTLLYRTDRTWPSTWFVPRLDKANNAYKDVYSVMANWGANHGAFSYGHIGKELITLASMLRIPVSMHNIEDKDIYRPHAWSAFGTKNIESADYRACKNYGALYK